MYRRVAVKVGSNVLTRSDGTLDITRMSALVDQLADLRRRGVEVILVSSGAVASGRSEMHLPASETEQMDGVEQRQLFSAVGQAKLMGRYVELFRDHGIHVETGVFQTDMQVSLVNDGPTTLLMDSTKLF